jgi:hypothetical protein
VTTEVAPAASGRLSVANPLSGRGPRLIHHPFSVDCRASLRKGLVERYLVVAGDPAEHESSRTEWLMEEIDAAHVGHNHKSLTLDTYAHVLIDD